MAILLIVAALSFAPWGTVMGAAAAAPELHLFTNDSGQSFKAQITAVTSDEVALKREDGQVFHPKISVFNKDDQIYIQLWAAKNAADHGKGAFEFRVTSIPDPITTSVNDANHRSTSTWTAYYKVQAKNLTFVNWSGLHFRYIIFKQSANAGKLPPDDFTPQRTTGTFDMDKCSGEEEKSFSTDKFPMQESRWAGNYFWDNGASAVTTDKLTGIWIRVYDDQENLLQEFISDPSISKNERWAFPRPGGARGGGGRGQPNPNGPRSTTPRGG